MGKTNEKKSVLDGHLKSVSKRVRSLLQKADRSDIESRYEISLILCGVLENAKYGKKAIESMEGEIGLSRQSLYRIARVAKSWPKADFAGVSKKKNSNGWPLTWSHFQVLAAVKDEALRQSLLRRALDESMTVEEVDAEAKAKKQGEKESTPQVEAPDAPASWLDVELDRRVGVFEKELGVWREKLLGDIERAASQMDGASLARLKETLERLTAAGKAMEVMADELKKLLPSVAPAMGQLHEMKPAPFVPRPFASAQP